jgi:hypothetical protein
MTVEEAVRVYLLDHAVVTALVRTRIYLDKLPQSPTYPAVRVQLVSDPKDYHLRGEDGLSRARVQVDAYQDERAADPYSAATVGAAVHAALSGARFDTGESPGVAVTGVFRVARRRSFEAGELRLLRISQDYYVWSRPM